MKSEYKRDMNHNYLILTGEDAIDTNSYQVRMIVANAEEPVSKFSCRTVPGLYLQALPDL